jgi:hypothetical protein
MFCRKCGKQIDYEAEFCKECQEMDAFFGENKPTVEEPSLIVEQEKPVLEGNRKEGFGKALTSTILGVLAYFLVSVALGLLMGLKDIKPEAFNYDYVAYEAACDLIQGIAIVITIIAIGLAIPSLILGIKSIKCFIKQKREGKVKPIATLILGIVGLAASGYALLFALINLLY